MRLGSLASLRIEPRLRRYVSAGLALGLVAGIIILPLSMLEGYRQRRAEIEDLQLDLDRLRNGSTGAKAKRGVASATNESMGGVLATNAEAAGAHIQATLRNLAAEIGSGEVRIESLRVLPSLPGGVATAMRTSASLTAPGPRIFDVVNALEASNPPIVIDSLRILSRSDANVGRVKGLPGTDLSRGELTLVLRVYAPSGAVPPHQSGSIERRTSGVERLP
ncbi:GspMb/PilO family protein [Methylorubrum extorquens]|uniref:General secretion pathway protein M n=1 Tax=Methylorubrum extorquens (strain ATCC 14718 / DSM 1338 / JCM 2805 / NCIMB 9133 / AM1) TaxID=272630 RepID=C5B3X9_METEA|nr:GspMb/PilO family protein [Methylorubrum extorquens]ACS43161.1 Hypothetical protein MexAM1_META2p0280 [Methylorubrum extorquens AM1]MCP1545765.1 hypothetical protein [Methylorubrum extorquens]MCP1591716.1 hypothetical protein [Methylorubrum extorquens]